MISLARFLLLGLLGFESILASPTNLLPLERQKKSLQEDLAFFLPEKSTFRERQSGLIKSAAKSNKRSGIPSFFSERQHLVDAEELKRKRTKGHSSAPSQSYAPYQEQWDPWFPALQEQKRLDMNSEREAIDSALKHMAWERLNKRLIKLRGLQGPFLDRGERRIRIKKRAPKPLEEKKELEAILSDDVEEEKKRAKQDPTNSVANIKNGTKNESKKIMKQNENSNVQKIGPKGKQWMPLDSEPTLRSKKSWDDYFGIDKRSSRALPSPLKYIDDDDENEDEAEQELKDYLVQWYFNKMLKHLSPSEEITKDDETKKKKKSIKLIEKDMQIKDENDDDIGDNIDLSDGIPFEEVDERLRKIENAILSEATSLIENGMNANEKKGFNEDNTQAMKEAENDVIDHLKAAFSLEKMRDALEEFQESFKKIKMQEGARYRAAAVAAEKLEDDKKKKRKKSETEFDDEDEDDDDKKKKKKSVSKKSTSSRQSTQSNGENTWSKAAEKNLEGKSDLTNEVASPVFAPEHHDKHYLPCPVMTGALGYCEELSDALGEMGQRLARPCVEHMLCYTCDETPSSCDMAFLQDASELCEDDFRCQAIAGAMRSVFLSNHDEFRFQHEALCDVDQCLIQLQLQQSK